MAFGFKTAGPRTPRLKYNAQAGRLFRVERIQDAEGNWQNTDVDITDTAAFVLDRDSLRMGWCNYANFARILVRVTETLPPQPEGKDAQGRALFRGVLIMRLKLSKACGGDVREFNVSSQCAMDAIERLFKEWTTGAHANDDLCPVIQLKGTTPVVSESGGQKRTNFTPNFVIVSWMARPADLTPVTDATYDTTGNADATAGPSPAPSRGNGTSQQDLDDIFPEATAPTSSPAGRAADVDLDFG